MMTGQTMLTVIMMVEIAALTSAWFTALIAYVVTKKTVLLDSFSFPLSLEKAPVMTRPTMMTVTMMVETVVVVDPFVYFAFLFFNETVSLSLKDLFLQ